MSFKGKVVIVTGGSSGIGAATAIAFAAEGASLSIVGRNEAKLKKVAAKCEQKGSKPLIIIADVCNKKDADRILSETLQKYGKLDVLVNNAGIFTIAGILAPNAMEEYERIITTNLNAVVYLTYRAVPHLIETKGNIVSVSSIASKAVTLDNGFAYLASKAGLDHFSRSIAFELAPKGVRVNTVNPGTIRSDILKTIGISEENWTSTYEGLGKQAPLQRVGEPEEIADLILFLASDKARSVTGSSYVSDNGSLMAGILKL